MAMIWGRSLGYNIDVMRLKRERVDYTIITDGVDCYPWREYFAIIPRKTVTGKRIFWEKAYKRNVWVAWGHGFHLEPETQYATAFDLLTYDDNTSL